MPWNNQKGWAGVGPWINSESPWDNTGQWEGTTPTPPPGTDALLLEDGNYLLLEDGGLLLLE